LKRVDASHIARLFDSRCSFDDSDFVLCQSVELARELVNLLVRRRDLALDGGFVGRGASRGQVPENVPNSLIRQSRESPNKLSRASPSAA
jgi:hypothetical protein